MGVTIRPAQAGDLSGLLELFRELAGGRPGALPVTAPAAERLFEQIRVNPDRTLLVTAAGWPGRPTC